MILQIRGYGLWVMGFWPIFIPGGGTCGMRIYRENRIQESEVRSQEKSGSCLFSWMGAALLAMAIYRENV